MQAAMAKTKPTGWIVRSSPAPMLTSPAKTAPLTPRLKSCTSTWWQDFHPMKRLFIPGFSCSSVLKPGARNCAETTNSGALTTDSRLGPVARTRSG